MDIDQSAEILRLRVTVRDLLALSIIPEAWVGREPPAIAADLADLLIGSLKLDFAFVRLGDPIGCQAVEVIRGHGWKGFPEWLQQRFVRFGQVSRTEIVTNVGGVETSCCGVVIPIGVNSERGLIAAACDRSDFPDQIDQQLLSVAANNAAIAFQNARLINELRTAQKALCEQEQELRKARDELETKVAERTSELRRSEKELRDVIDTIPATVWSALPDGSNAYANKHFVEYSGLSAEQTGGSGWQAATHPDDLQQHLGNWMASVATGKPFEDEARYRRSDGQYRRHLCRGVPLRDDEGRIVRWYGILFDIDELKKTESALQVREHELLGIIETIPSMLWSVSPTGETTHLSQRVVEYCGVPLEELVNRGWEGSIHPDDREGTVKAFVRAIETGESYGAIHRLRRADGEYRWHESRGEPLRDPHGKIIQWYGLTTDIDERKRAEEALQQNQFYLAEGQRLAHMGSWAFNPSGFFEYWSQELFKIYGLDPEKCAPTLEQYLAAVHPQDRDFMANTIKRMHAECSGCDVKKRIVRPDGELRYIRCVGIPVIEGEALKGFLGTAMDITEQELLTQELERQQAHLTEAQKLTHTGSWVRRLVDRKMKTEHLSEEWYRIYGFDPADGSPTWEEFLERVHPEDRLEWKGITERAIVERADYDQEFRILLPNGKVKWIHTVGHPVLSNSGDLEQFVGSSTDITERKSAEQERERLRQLEADLAHTNRVSTLGEMAASLAHEIKQPISAAITSANSCIEWLAHEPPNLDRARVAAARIDKYGNRATEIIDRIRSLYKKSPPQRELVDVNGIIEEMLTLLNGEANRYSVAVRTEFAADLPKIMADRVQLQQVFMNLMLNAIEAMKDAGGELTVKSELQDGQLQFSVSDTGMGLPTEKMDQIFSAFYTTKPQGSGMGLAISRSIVESHGGRLWATANDGRGATFYFTLPTAAETLQVPATGT
jgi:PAS domain S-box-containing protein